MPSVQTPMVHTTASVRMVTGVTDMIAMTSMNVKKGTVVMRMQSVRIMRDHTHVYATVDMKAMDSVVLVRCTVTNLPLVNHRSHTQPKW